MMIFNSKLENLWISLQRNFIFHYHQVPFRDQSALPPSICIILSLYRIILISPQRINLFKIISYMNHSTSGFFRQNYSRVLKRFNNYIFDCRLRFILLTIYQQLLCNLLIAYALLDVSSKNSSNQRLNFSNLCLLYRTSVQTYLCKFSASQICLMILILLFPNGCERLESVGNAAFGIIFFYFFQDWRGFAVGQAILACFLGLSRWVTRGSLRPVETPRSWIVLLYIQSFH